MVSIITCVYERKEYMRRLFESLLTQTSQEFDWTIIDDGSVEPMIELINEFQAKAKFTIFYKKIEHGGKHRALNEAIKLINNEAFIIVDSDDVLVDDCVEKMSVWWNEISDNSEFLGAAGRMEGFDGVISGGETPFDNYADGLWTERVKFGFTGEAVYIFRKKYWLEYPFPEYVGEDFCSEALIMLEFSNQGWKIRWHGDVVYKYEYLSDGLTKNITKKFSDNPKGYAEYIACKRRTEGLSQLKYMSACRNYYEICYSSIDNKEVQKILGLNDEENKLINQSIEMTISNLDRILHGQKAWSIYGWGHWGHILSYYFKICGYTIEGIYDKRGNIFHDARVEDIEFSESKTENIIICMKNIDQEVEEIIKSQLNNSNVVYMNSFYSDWEKLEDIYGGELSR